MKPTLTTLALLIITALTTTAHDAPHAHPQQHTDTVVCVHGFMRSMANHYAMAKALQPHHRVINYGYPTRDKTFQQHGAELVLKLKEIAAAHPGQPIHFVTHSMGGLVVRTALSHPDCPPEAILGRAILLAPPNDGSYAARNLHWLPPARWIFGNHAGRQLMTTPPGGFDALGTFPDHMPVYIIAGDLGFNPFVPGPDDGKVAVQETRLPTPHHLITIHTSHSLIAWTPKVITTTKTLLAQHQVPTLTNN